MVSLQDYFINDKMTYGQDAIFTNTNRRGPSRYIETKYIKEHINSLLEKHNTNKLRVLSFLETRTVNLRDFIETQAKEKKKPFCEYRRSIIEFMVSTIEALRLQHKKTELEIEEVSTVAI